MSLDLQLLHPTCNTYHLLTLCCDANAPHSDIVYSCNLVRGRTVDKDIENVLSVVEEGGMHS